MTKLFTLCFVLQPTKILLGMKKRGFGAGRWNGFGGKVQPGEVIEQAARRECKEEAGIEMGDLKKHGVITFEFQGNPDLLEVHVYSTATFTGEPVESEEMRPQWFETSTIPYNEMWADDIYWLPLLLEGKTFTGTFLFGPGDSVLSHTVVETAL